MAESDLNEEAWADFDTLLEIYMDATAKILQKDKFIIPMAMIFNTAGEPEFVALQSESEEGTVDMTAHLKAYRQLLRQHPDNTRACLLGYDIRISVDGYNDGVALELEHRNGTLQKMVIPYRFTGLLKKKLEMAKPRLAPAGDEHILHHK